ncbi:MAG TPA: hypothetical protein VG742_11180 [Dongiaceae bacterium]|nr:hypothetical protein [Dongiaceae bacterium]
MSSIGAQRLARACVGIFSIYLCLAVTSIAEDKSRGETLPVKFFVDVTSTRLADEVKSTDKRKLNLGGVPVMLGALRQDGGALPSVAAGISGSYDFKLGDVGVKTNGYLARVHTQGAGLLADARAGGDVTLQYSLAGANLSLKPSARAAFRDDAVDHVDYALNGSLSRSIVKGWNFTLSGGQFWRVSELVETDDRSSAYGRLGLRVDLLQTIDVRGSLELGYEMDEGEGQLGWQNRFSHGPSVGARFNPLDGWTFSGRYRYSESEWGYDDNDLSLRHNESRHRINLEGDWALDSLTGADWHMKACYNFEQITGDQEIELPVRHVATVQFALNF